eukprot:CAMPEP_0113412226 /NCGR_PEP_ID=MMETSP0013_2-20120614/22717_1 /TAXON_ID=2843 ORGANISM="Skeletonema costatum, Strain 1716" /NCGR_SAMPLE_ID=MMETSP0013_2 /ASSEMBLY_ACC=CAM_ASM_000158 /LENGTH=238 /DNA_ID=CAMNT_0000298695 /DNA_START=188 /DNA_END=904 /DNA_ORIENTATION=- /assembly_acc=CAM_ASM_000158
MLSSASSSLVVVIKILLTLASITSLTESFSTVSLTQRSNNFNIICPPSSWSSSSCLHAISNPLRRRQRSSSSTDTTNTDDTTKNKRQAKHSNLIQHITTITDYKDHVVDETHNITVVRFYSHFCRSCRASEPHFFQLARDFQNHNVNFVEVPLTPSTKVLHEALGVPSLPWTHIYHPEAGLVEERKVSKKFIKEVRSALRCYVYGECDVEEDAPADCRVVYGECAIDDFDDDGGGNVE